MKTARHTYGSDPLRAPAIQDGDKIILDECGRDLDFPEKTYGVCYCSHWFRVIQREFGGYFLLVKHGGGEEAIPLGFTADVVNALGKLSSDERYLTLHLLHKVNRNAEIDTTRKVDSKWRKAIAEKRIIRRKVRGQDAYFIGIKEVTPC